MSVSGKLCEIVFSLFILLAAPTQACQEGSVRLVNGTIEQEGRVEVCIGGLWGSMCYSTWNNPSANRFVVCNQLGHRSSSGSINSCLSD